MQFMVDNVDVAVRDAFKYSVNYMFKNYSLDVLGNVWKIKLGGETYFIDPPTTPQEAKRAAEELFIGVLIRTNCINDVLNEREFCKVGM